MSRSATTPLARLAEQLEGATVLDGASRRIAATVEASIPEGKPRALLEGRWLGHALHPVLSDLPIGAWTSSVILDLLGGDSAEGSADLLVAVGLAAALPTALSGWTDWSRARDEQRRVGLVHAAANISALAMFALSLRRRRAGRRAAGRLLSGTGVAAMGAAAYLGGHLSFARGVGVEQRW